MPARKAAPRVVASRTGDTSTGRPAGVGQGLHEHRLALMPPSTRSGADGAAGVGLGRFDQVGAPVGDPLEHGPHHLGPAAAPGEAEQRAPGAEVPVRRAQAEQGRDEAHAAAVGAPRRDRVGLGRGGDQAEVVAEPFDRGAGRQHDRLDAPGQLAVAPPGDDREAAALAPVGERRARRPGTRRACRRCRT